MSEPQYVAAKQVCLAFHLETFFKRPIPTEHRTAMMTVFTRYWNKEIDLDELQIQLRDEAGYKSELHEFEMYKFLNHEDFH